ncbi:nitrate- and nitrite sensing domain-containing protein [Mangrovactinospora gilvigrisea]|uniref:nitrate- and nitrite sensing domain-containing protein n=1 Tax=Mangrovactinospora gilvigrisea TaxID=1428644 RepID=UPI0015874A04|nr:nitrate- and nitrite sensing domain-containing protein [Mangrovactinospora gilvigrisea]
MRNWRVTTRLGVIMVIPALVALVFVGLRVNDQVRSAREASDAADTARLVQSATTLADKLQTERDFAASHFTAHDRHSTEVDDAYAATDAAVRQFHRAADGAPKGDINVQQRIKTANAQLAKLTAVRKASYADPKQPLATQVAYSNLFAPLPAFDNDLGLRTGTVTSRARAIYALSLTKASLSTQRNIVSRVLVTHQASPDEIAGILASRQITDTARNEFLTGALQSDIALYQRTVHSPDIAATTRMENMVLASAQAGKPVSAGTLTEPRWFDTSSTEINQIRQVEQEVTRQILDESVATKDRAIRDAIISSSIAIGVLLIGALFTLGIARSMARGMRTLRRGALEVAQRRLPDLVAKLAGGEPERVDTTVAPIPLHSQDEIGEVARAFDAVHREAVRLAGEQALMRGNINSIFTNLSRRSQGLIERQLSLITDLENNESDPDQLSNLFKLDHLATRMRRNGENLLVLAGEEPGRLWTESVPLVDVLRAAASEVEQYERIMLRGVPDAEIAGPAVNDLVHLLAELLENATAFSSPNTNVRITGTRLQDGRVLVEIHDEGIGLTEDDFNRINERLSRPPVVDVAVSQRMGLFVVGRLAARHGVRVQLRASADSPGTTSLVMLPEQITRLAADDGPEEEFTVSRIMGGRHSAEPSAPVSQLGAGTAEADIPDLERLSRSLRRQLGSLPQAPAIEAGMPDAGMPDAGPMDQGPMGPAGGGAPGMPGLPRRQIGPGPQQGGPQQPQLPQASQAPQMPQAPMPQAPMPQAPQPRVPQPQPPRIPQVPRMAEPGQPYGESAEPDGQAGPAPSAPAGRTDSGLPRRQLPQREEQPYAPGQPAQYPEYTQQQYAEQQPYAAPAQPDEALPDYSGYSAPQPYEGGGYPEPDSRQAPQYPAPDGPYSTPDASYAPQEGPHSPGTGASPAYLPDPQNGYSDAPGYFEQPYNSGEFDGFGNGPAAPGGPVATGMMPEPPAQQPSLEDDGAGSATYSEDTQEQTGSLPRRTPRAQRPPGGTAQANENQQYGPSVSRNPDAVRGRLTNLRRGVQQGRRASEGHGPNPHQEQQ